MKRRREKKRKLKVREDMKNKEKQEMKNKEKKRYEIVSSMTGVQVIRPVTNAMKSTTYNRNAAHFNETEYAIKYDVRETGTSTGLLKL